MWRLCRIKRPVSSGFRALLSSEKLRLTPRFDDLDLGLLRSTTPHFKNLLRARADRRSASPEETSAVAMNHENSVQVEIQAYAPQLESIASLEEAEEFLDAAIVQRAPNAALHVLGSLRSDIQIPSKLSKEVLALVMERGPSKSLIEVRSLMHRTLAPLSLDVHDINDCITYCLLNDMVDEAFKWFLVMEDSFDLRPTAAIVAMLLPALAKVPSWERLFYVLNEAQRLQVPIPLRVRYSLLQACRVVSASRWRYVPPFLAGIDSPPFEEGAGDKNSADYGTIVKCVELAMQICVQERKYEEVLSIFDGLSAGTRLALGDSRAQVFVGIAAIQLRREDVISQLREGAASKTGDMINPGKPPSSAVGLVWTLVTRWTEMTARERVEFEGSLRGLEGQVLRILSHLAGRHTSTTLSVEPSASGIWKVYADTCGVCLDAYEDGSEHSPGVAAALSLDSDVVSRLVPLFCQAGDHINLVRLLVLSQGSGVVVDSESFSLASQYLLHCGQLELVVEMLDKYLEQIETTGDHLMPLGYKNRGNIAGSTPTRGSPMRIFAPALEALARMGDLDGMVQLLLREVPYHERRHGRSGWPSTMLFLKGMEGFRRAERYSESVELFKIAANGPQEYLMDITGGEEGEEYQEKERSRDSREMEEGMGGRSELSQESLLVEEASAPGLGPPGLRGYPEYPKSPPSPVLIHAALRSCAAGSLGEDALQIFHMAESCGAFAVHEEGGVPKQAHMQAAHMARNAENIVISLASPKCISALVPFVQHVRSSSLPIAITHSLHTACMAAALWARHEETAVFFLNLRHDEELHRELSPLGRAAVLSRALKYVSDRFHPSKEDLAEVEAFAASL